MNKFISSLTPSFTQAFLVFGNRIPLHFGKMGTRIFKSIILQSAKFAFHFECSVHSFIRMIIISVHPFAELPQCISLKAAGECREIKEC